ncbi:MAG: glycosyltransferase [Elainellaceae cyanobacterium]
MTLDSSYSEPHLNDTNPDAKPALGGSPPHDAELDADLHDELWDQGRLAREPLVSVIVPIYNGEADLPALVHHLRAQTYAAERVEYLLVDNQSRDRTSELLHQFAQAPLAQGSLTQDSGDRPITLIPLRSDRIQSSYAARNVGIKAAKGDILVFTDADCRPAANWLVELVKPFAQDHVGLVAGEIIGLPGQTLLEIFAERQGTLSQKHTLNHPFSPYGQTANLAVRRAALTSVGLFRPYLTTGGDADLCWRILRSTGWQMHWAQKAVVQHRHRSTLAELRRQWHRYGRSNRYLHDLHGIALTPELTWKDYGYRIGRWLLKEVPRHGLGMMQGKSDRADLLATPISLMCIAARSQGQRQARLPLRAQQIESW